MSSSSSTTSPRGREFIPGSYHPGAGIPPTSVEHPPVARVLICEPHDDISALLELVVRRLGHEPVCVPDGDVEHVHVDAAVIEPGEASGLRLARSLTARRIPVLFTSIYPADSDLLALQ